ncbi:MAG: hypothetical protein Q7K55_05420 [Candidatus Levybacteria bacterium]|nr:hypothetical protein [Candidatus Levybacteria bacterium]
MSSIQDLEKEHIKQITKLNNRFYLLTAVIVLALLCIILFQPISSYFKKKSIKENANSHSILEINNACEGISEDKVNMENINKCLEESKKMEPVIKNFNDFIMVKDDVDCGDFISGTEARQFYEYVGGMNITLMAEAVKQAGQEALLRYLINNKNKIDPYNLDKNNDGFPCENN